MAMFYLILIFIIGKIIYSIVQAFRTKKYVDLIYILFMIPFLVFFVSSVMLGGSAFNDASNSYSLFEQGHYYLASHGNYKEVSYNTFLYMRIIEIIGITSFIVGFIFMIIRNNRKKQREKKVDREQLTKIYNRYFNLGGNHVKLEWNKK